MVTPGTDTRSLMEIRMGIPMTAMVTVTTMVMVPPTLALFISAPAVGAAVMGITMGTGAITDTAAFMEATDMDMAASGRRRAPTAVDTEAAEAATTKRVLRDGAQGRQQGLVRPWVRFTRISPVGFSFLPGGVQNVTAPRMSASEVGLGAPRRPASLESRWPFCGCM